MARFSQKDLAIIGAAIGTADFLLEGRLSAPAARALKKYVLPQAARAAPRLGSTAFQVGKTIALRHPVLTAGAILYYTYKNREEIGNLVEQGYEVIQPGLEATGQFIGEVNPGFDLTPERGVIMPPIRIKRKVNKFSKAVGAGVKAVKASKFQGAKGKLSNPKRTFSTVTKVASRLKKGRKVGTKGVTGTIRRAIGRFL